MRETYYLGLDMGTSSVGWAVTDEHYHLVRKKGKDLWGVRLFSEAETAADRRSHRVSRRRRQREQARIGYLREIFAEEINRVDAGFYQRMDDSKYFEEDKKVGQPFALFADTGYTDKEYYQDYPTIFHLRKELICSQEPHDVRLVYLAILNMFKHRGHFLNAGLGDDYTGSFKELYESIKNAAMETLGIEIAHDENLSEAESILSSKEYTNTRRKEELLRAFGINGKTEKQQAEMWKLVCGLKGTISIIFKDEVYDEETRKLSVSFSEGSFEEKCGAVEEVLSEESYELFLLLKQMYDWGILSGIMKNGDTSYEYLSFARVASYEKHNSDLKKLKLLFKTYAPEKYDDMFRVMRDNNYSAYVGSVNSGKEILRRGGKKKTDDFYSDLKKIIHTFPESSEKQEILSEIERGVFLPKQLTSNNGVIPNQVHKKELKAILSNAETYLPFLKEKDGTGLTASERTIQLFEFQIPYYVGPLVNTKENRAWSVRKASGRVMPWNFEEKIDTMASSEKFISQMVRHCTYLNGEMVLPKNSLLYEKYMVLNELNNLRVNGEKISVDLKQELYNNLFKSGKKVTGKRVENYLKIHGYVESGDAVAISGIDGDFTNRLSNYAKFAQIFGVETLTYEQEQIAEKIIFWSTVYGDSRKFLRDKITQEYSSVLSKEQIRRIAGIRFKDWGRLSRELLELEGADVETGEVATIISRMWNENYNLMELIEGEKFNYKEMIESKTHKMEKTLTEIEYDDLNDLYVSAPVKRMIWQTILICKELYHVIGSAPGRIFVEMARDQNAEKKRTVSRKNRFADLYKNCKEDGIDWKKAIAGTDEAQFRSKKLYLYYTQKGRCMYTGERIELSDLFNDNLYDIDHIYPRHFVKDDSIENNLVLVKKEKNAHKSDSFPIEAGIRHSQKEWWKALKDGGFITPEKYNRLIRNEDFTDEERAKFISRQIVETRQGTKVIAELFGQTFKDSEIVYAKAGNVSDFRQKFGLVKCRNLNDFHHANDAYLNIVVGNAYFVKFTRSPINFIKQYRKDPKKNAYHMDRIFDFTISRNGEIAWQTENNESIRVVKNVMRRNTPLVTRMNYELKLRS